MPEADLALFISHDAIAAPNTAQQSVLRKGLAVAAADTTPTWEFLGGTVNSASKTISKGGIGGFSRLTVARGFVFLADKSVKIDRNVTSEGDIHSNGDITFEKGDPGTHTGDLTAGDDIEIEKNNAIVGNAFAADRLIVQGNATVSGTATGSAAVTQILLPAPAFTSGEGDVAVSKYGVLHLDPGAYDDIEVKKGGTLFLRSGDYFFDKFDTDDEAVISIDVANGPVYLNVVSDLEFDKEVEIIITPGGQSASNQVTFTTLQHKKVDIDDEALILGWIIAPNAEVHFDEGCRFKGSVVAKSISVDEDVMFVSHASTQNLTKARSFTPEELHTNASQNPITAYELLQNYPNPFNPSTNISFRLKEQGPTQLVVYNLQGQVVRTLVSGAMAAGQHLITWDGRNDAGQLVPSGIYLYRLNVNDFVQTRKMSLVK